MVHHGASVGKSFAIYGTAYTGCVLTAFSAHPLHALYREMAECAPSQLPDRPFAIGRRSTAYSGDVSAYQSPATHEQTFGQIFIREVTLSPPYPPQGGLVLFCKGTKMVILFSLLPKKKRNKRESKKRPGSGADELIVEIIKWNSLRSDTILF